MDTESQENKKETNTPQKPNLKEIIERNLVVFFLTTLLTGFIAGYTTYNKIVDTSGQVLVGKDTYILKKDLAGTILKSEAVGEIDHLIEIGQDVKDNDSETRIWLMRVLAFIHGLKLEKDSEWDGHPMSAIESDIRYALLDPSLEIQRQKTLGILQGFKAALRTQVSNP